MLGQKLGPVQMHFAQPDSEPDSESESGLVWYANSYYEDEDAEDKYVAFVNGLERTVKAHAAQNLNSLAFVFPNKEFDCRADREYKAEHRMCLLAEPFSALTHFELSGRWVLDWSVLEVLPSTLLHLSLGLCASSGFFSREQYGTGVPTIQHNNTLQVFNTLQGLKSLKIDFNVLEDVGTCASGDLKLPGLKQLNIDCHNSDCGPHHSIFLHELTLDHVPASCHLDLDMSVTVCCWKKLPRFGRIDRHLLKLRFGHSQSDSDDDSISSCSN